MAPPFRGPPSARRSELPAESSFLPGGHYEAFVDGREEAIAIQLSFLRRQLLDGSHDDA